MPLLENDELLPVNKSQSPALVLYVYSPPGALPAVKVDAPNVTIGDVIDIEVVGFIENVGKPLSISVVYTNLG